MSGFRKSDYWMSLSPSYPIIEVQSQTIDEMKDGEIVSRAALVPVNVSSPDAAKNLPTYKEYYVENLVNAGVPLEQVNVSSYFNAHDTINLERVRLSALSDLESKLSKKISE